MVLVQLLALAACGKGGGKSNSADAAALSQKISPPQYALVEPKDVGDSWTQRGLSACEGRVFYIASQGDSYSVRSIDAGTGQITELASYADMSFNDISVSPDGTIYLLASSAADEYAFLLIELGADGVERGRFDLSELEQDAAWNPRELEVSQDYVYISDGKRLISAKLGKAPKLSRSVELTAGASLTRLRSGEPVIAFKDDDDYKVQILDTGKLRVSSEFSFNKAFTNISGGDTWDLYLGDNSAVYGYRLADGAMEKLFSWTGIGIIGGSVAEAGGNLVCSGLLSEGSPNPPLILRPIEPSENESSVIRFATTDPMGLDFRVQAAIREWNIDNPQCPIEVIDYSVYSTGSDTRASTMKLTADIISGDMPDIYDFSLSSVDTIPSSAQFARRGLLENLYPYLDADPTLSRDDLIPGVLSAMEIDGGLYEFVPQYSLITTFADSRAVGSEENWNYDALNKAVEDSDFFESIFNERFDRMFLLGNMLNASGGKLVDWSCAQCHFDSKYFKSLLETVKAMPETGIGLTNSNLSVDLLNSTGLLYYVQASDLWIASTCPFTFGDNYCFPGLPEIGSVIYPSCCYAISAFSANKEACWRFLRQFWTEKYNLHFFLSPRYDGLSAQVERCWEQIGETQKYHPYGITSMEALVDIIENSRVVYRHDPQIWQIVYSEVGAYFAGDKSAEDTMAQIQAKASLYLAEQCG